MANMSTAGSCPETIAFPPVLLGGELQHIFCNAGEPDEFLASAHAWLELFVLAQDPALDEGAVWARVQAAHDEALLQVVDQRWRDELEERLATSLLKVPAYARMWEQLAVTANQARTVH